MPSPEVYPQEMSHISLLHFFPPQFSVDCRSGRDTMKVSSPFSRPVWGHVHLMLCRPPKLRYHGLFYSQVVLIFFLVERVFVILIHIFPSVIISPSLFCPAHSLRKGQGLSRLREAVVHLSLTGSFSFRPTHPSPFLRLNTLCAFFNFPAASS